MKVTNDNELNKKSEVAKCSKSHHEAMGQYHQELVKWARNVDKRYAWIVLAALWVIMGCVLGPYRLYGLIYAQVTKEEIYTREQASWPVSMIFTVENICGPFVSVIAYHISGRNSIFVGGLLLTIGNTLAYWSDSLMVDIITIGFVQGLGFAFIFMPFMEVINSYFLKYRNVALGFALCGGTMSIFITEPLYQWLLRTYPWRTAYLGFGIMCSLIILMVPFLKPNPRPKPPNVKEQQDRSEFKNKASKLSRVSFRALTYQNSLRRQTTILVSRRKHSLDRQASIVSVNPFATSAGLERRISRSINENFQPKQCQAQSTPVNKLDRQLTLSKKQNNAIDTSDNFETKSLSEIGQEPNDEFSFKIIIDILMNPGFHLIWYLELLYFWVFTIFCLILIDFGLDHGCTLEQAESLLGFQSAGEIIGRMGLTVLVDMRFLSNRNVVTLNLIIVATLLVLVTHINGIVPIAIVTVLFNAFASLLYIMLNGLLVDFLGESHVTLGYGMASFVVGVLIIFRPHAVGYFRDTLGSYDLLMMCLAAACAIGALFCILEPLISRVCRPNKSKYQNETASIA